MLCRNEKPFNVISIANNFSIGNVLKKRINGSKTESSNWIRYVTKKRIDNIKTMKGLRRNIENSSKMHYNSLKTILIKTNLFFIETNLIDPSFCH